MTRNPPRFTAPSKLLNSARAWNDRASLRIPHQKSLQFGVHFIVEVEGANAIKQRRFDKDEDGSMLRPWRIDVKLRFQLLPIPLMVRRCATQRPLTDEIGEDNLNRRRRPSLRPVPNRGEKLRKNR